MEIDDDINTLKTRRFLKIKRVNKFNNAFSVHVIGVTMKINEDKE